MFIEEERNNQVVGCNKKGCFGKKKLVYKILRVMRGRECSLGAVKCYEITFVYILPYISYLQLCICI